MCSLHRWLVPEVQPSLSGKSHQVMLTCPLKAQGPGQNALCPAPDMHPEQAGPCVILIGSELMVMGGRRGWRRKPEVRALQAQVGPEREKSITPVSCCPLTCEEPSRNWEGEAGIQREKQKMQSEAAPTWTRPAGLTQPHRSVSHTQQGQNQTRVCFPEVGPVFVCHLC